MKSKNTIFSAEEVSKVVFALQYIDCFAKDCGVDYASEVIEPNTVHPKENVSFLQESLKRDVDLTNLPVMFSKICFYNTTLLIDVYETKIEVILPGDSNSAKFPLYNTLQLRNALSYVLEAVKNKEAIDLQGFIQECISY